ncbi:MAG: phosphoribosylformylglycinamidine synthase subunit PurQ [Opitutales bacterium]
MRVAIIQFPGSNCDWDAWHAVNDVIGLSAERVWHKAKLPAEVESVIVPGGFSFGDYLRCGAIARFSPIMTDLHRFADNGGPVLGICNGFQILCEAGLLPGALIRNNCLEFRCVTQCLEPEDSTDLFNKSNLGERIFLPIAHGEGNYRLEENALRQLEENGQVLLRYAGAPAAGFGYGNPNGSVNDIAGVRNSSGNVFGMMPHPERVVETYHPGLDGIAVLKAFLAPLLESNRVELAEA